MEEYRYDAFEKAYTRDGKSNEWRESQESKTGNSRLFTGREYDRETGLYYYRARYYSAEMGRFVSRDPIGVKDNVNLYSYVGNSPVGFVDVMGLASKALLSIFGQAKVDFSSYNNETFFDKLSSWYKLETGLYDLTFHDGSKTTLFTEWERKNNVVLANATNNPLINIGGNTYELGQISNILVGFSAYNIGYSEEFLNAGSTAFNTVGGGNGLYEDNFDKFLYHVGYTYARGLKENNADITLGQIQGVIALGVAYRQQAASSPNIFDNVNQILDSITSWTR